MKQYYVYILANRRNGTLYVGVTNNLIRRMYEHKQGLIEGFTKTYGIDQLVWYEATESIESAILKEKRIKKWNRSWKIRLIEERNPLWRDLDNDLFDSPTAHEEQFVYGSPIKTFGDDRETAIWHLLSAI